jgi:hypothetical protein
MGKPSTEPPPRTRVDDDFDKAEALPDMSEKGRRMAQIAEAVAEQCPQLFEAFGKIYSLQATDDRHASMISALGPAILACKCKVDIPALRSLLYRLFVTKPIALLDLTLDEGASRIEMPLETPWTEANKRLGKDLKTVWLDVPRPPEPPPEEPTDAGP